MPILEGTAILKWLWSHKWELLALVILVLVVLYILGLKGKIALKEGTISKQQGVIAKQQGDLDAKDSKIKELNRDKEILENNILAIKAQEKQLKQIRKSTETLQGMLADLPKEVLQNEKITRANDCIVEFANTGRVSESCSMSIKTSLPKARPATTTQGRSQPSQ